MRYVCFDIETTGLHINDNHRLFEIGCVEIVDRQKTGRTFHYYCNPGRTLSKESKEICKIEDSFLIDKPSFGDICEEFIEFITKNANGEIEKAILLAHNAKFDTNFINNEFQLIGQSNRLDDFTIIDTIKIVKKKFPGQPANLDAVCTRLGVSLAVRGERGHGALLDSDILADAFIKLSQNDTDNELINFESSEIIFFGFAKQKSSVRERNIYSVRHAEIASHLAVLEYIKGETQ